MGNEYKKIISEKKGEAGRLMTGEQLKKCNVAIHTASAVAAASGAIPLPGADAIPISTAQITMVIALGKIFDKKLSEGAAKGLLSATVSTFVGRNLIKMIPIAGWIVSATVAAGVTEALGWTLAVDFAKMSSTKNAEPSDNQKTGQTDKEKQDNKRQNEEQQDDESMATAFARAFEEEEQ